MVGGDDERRTRFRFLHPETTEYPTPDWEFEDLQLDVRIATPCGSVARLHLQIEVDEDTRLVRRYRLHLG